ncbi:nuclear transport factor 2 family protein [Aquisalimonas sp. 2447]|uniref:nuclear transport factor 2 family protein n=1 Tax=Aquisalimonas sp. 2447 TaxID=2740807 RepID=UPI0014323A1B|nr:nuclear transport factor 2 family protein [Aquisalimonas sp. 2447]QIT56730.1 nuclear transport factor 2 family protein [Aquisalimonas sp. 2447]
MDPKTLVEQYLQAVQAQDYRAARGYLADTGFEHVSPLGRLDSADDLVNQSFMSSGIVRRVDVRKVFADGGDVCHFLVYHVQISERHAVDLAHWARVEDGRIVRIEVLFDASLYRELFPGVG